LGSRSIHQKALLGRPIGKGDILRTASVSMQTGSRRLPESYIPEFPKELCIRVIMGPQDDYFTREGIDTFLSEPYTITPDSDRQGYRLKGPIITHRSGADIISDAILPGSVQVPGNGQPIIMMVDAQTTGGYTKIACVIGPDIDLLAQLLPGRKVRFQKVSVQQAHEILRQREACVEAITHSLIPCESVFPTTRFQP